MKTLSLVVPCYNEQETIKPFMAAMKQVEKSMSQKLLFDYLFVDDGSRDQTLAVLKQITNDKANVNYLAFSRNFGKEAALLAGLEHARGDLIVVMDVDLQDPPELIPDMFQKIEEGYDVVATRRKDRKGEPPIRSFFSKLFYKLINMTSDTDMVDGARDYRMMTRQVVNSILKMREINRFSKGLFAWVGYDVYYMSFDNRERVAGETSWSFWGLLKYSIEGFVNFSEILLSLATMSGFLSFIASLIGICIVIIRKIIIGGSVSGWASLVCIILFMGGLQLLAIGILGKYISKIFLETKKRPHYIVKEGNLDV
ncbi:glycosyltransferase family 2 protein [Streptococcus suis]|nr:glycosyltransferase family 2 protein [Streptococcus suis]